MKFNVHGGHNHHVTGAKKYLDEVKEDRIVKDEVIRLLRAEGHTVYDCTDNDGRTQKENLYNIVRRCNAHSVDLDISIHLNAGGGAGVEVWQYDNRTKAVADRICTAIADKLGIRNRGSKVTRNLYVLNKTESKAILIECCFVDSKADYDAWGGTICARAIVEGLLGYTVSERGTEENTRQSVKEIAKEVADGKWGNGRERKRRLENAGYDYQEVQREVNARYR